MAPESARPFNYDLIPEGFYHFVTESGHPVRRAWHLQKFERVIDCLPDEKGLSVLDVGCSAGTFLSLLPAERFSRQLGVDIVGKQIDFANRNFRTGFREFRPIGSLRDLGDIEETFDCITFIEVIEHLSKPEIHSAFDALARLVKKGGRLVISTPNYTSLWPALEFLLNHFSDVSYEEQHLTKFTYFNAQKRLEAIYPPLNDHFRLRIKTTTHFVSPFLAGISLDLAARASRLLRHDQWRFPFGSLLLLQFERL